MITINILIYTDSKDISEQENAVWSVSTVKTLIEGKSSPFARYKVEVINRYEGFKDEDFPGKAEVPQKLTCDLLKRFDEIWFFGTYQVNVDQPWHQLDGGRENELDCDELKGLTSWMRTGGVLMGGDHSVHEPKGTPADDPKTFLCLGKALGHRVPRAGQLRKWDGPPTNLENTSFNTLAHNLASDNAQRDEVPQVLKLVKGTGGSFHRLLMGRVPPGIDIPIDVFPDHKHEGEVIVPDPLDCEWPPFDDKDDSKKPEPAIIAFGCDKRFCESKPVLAVYDGDTLNVGRIVADSSWHHYFDINLLGLKGAVKNSVWELMSQFYTNVALYLAPLDTRREMSRAMIDWIANHPDVKEEKGNLPFIIGEVALSRLSQLATRFELSELLQSGLPLEEVKSVDQFADFLPQTPGLGPGLPQELVLGSIVARHYAAASARLRSDVADAELLTSENVIAEGLKDAIRTHRAWLSQVASDM